MRIDCSRLDRREYRQIQLENGLQALLVSIPTYSTDDSGHAKTEANSDSLSAASLCIRVGTTLDPEEMPGLSNLLCRVLIAGSEKYSSELRFTEYTREHRGHVNSYVTEEFTSYQFETEPSNFESGLDRFSRLFIDPLLPSDLIGQHVENIEKEFGRMKLRDQAIVRHFIQTLAKPSSPLRKFHKGNKKSILGEPERTSDEIRELLVKHFQTHYSSHLMTLAVQSTHNLDELESMVKKSFHEIPRRASTETNTCNINDSFQTPQFYRIYEIAVNKEKDDLRLIWSIPCLRPAYRYNPMLILSTLIRNMQEGSLAYHLDENHLATDVECEFGTLCGLTNGTLCTLLIVRMNLMPTGVQRIPEVCGAVYDYLKFLTNEAERCHSESELNRWDFLTKDEPHSFATFVHELQLLQECRFMNQPIQPSLVNTTWLANMMQRVEPQDSYSGYSLIKETNFQFYHDLISRLSKQKACIIHGSPQLRTDKTRLADCESEPWFGIKYTSYEIPEDITECRLRERPELSFSLPVRNRNAAEKFNELPCANETKLPVDLNAKNDRLRYHDYGRLWFQSAKRFENPTASFFIRVASGTPLDSSKNSSLLLLYVEGIRSELKRVAQAEKFRQMKYSVQVVDTTIEIRVSGPSEHIREFYYNLVSRSFRRTSNMDLDQFEWLKATVRAYLLASVKDPVVMSRNLLHVLTHKPAFSLSDQLDSLESLAMADLLAFSTQLFAQLRLIGYCVGDLDPEEVSNLYDRTIRSASCLPWVPQKEVHSVTFGHGSYYLEQQNPDNQSGNIYMERFHITKDSDPQAIAYNTIIATLMNKDAKMFFNAFSSAPIQVSAQHSRSIPSTTGYGILSVRVTTEYQAKSASNVERFLSFFCLQLVPMLIAGMEAMEFQKLRSSVMAALKKRYKESESQMLVYWDCILRNETNFRAYNEILTSVKCLTRESLLNYYCTNYVHPENLKSVTICIVPPTPNRPQKRRTVFTTSSTEQKLLDESLDKYIQTIKLDKNALGKYPEWQALVSRAFPERIERLFDIRAFKRNG